VTQKQLLFVAFIQEKLGRTNEQAKNIIRNK
jgi:hypothetical protein